MGRLKFRIENGITIISTGDAEGGKKNKHGHTGIYYNSRRDVLRAEITYKNKKYHLGYSNDIDALVLLRREAEIHVKNGSFLEWFELRKGKKNGKRD